MNFLVSLILITSIQGFESVRNIDDRVDRLEAIVRDQARRLESMEKIIASHQKDKADQKKETKEIRIQKSNFKDKRSLCLKRGLTRSTAFYAYMSKHELSPGRHHTLIFDTVKTNVNKAYSPYTGVFTVPSTGTYVFTTSLRLSRFYYGSFEFIKNAEAVGNFYAAPHFAPNQDTVTGIIVINANKGDVVYLRTHATHHGKGHIYSDNLGLATFSGWSI